MEDLRPALSFAKQSRTCPPLRVMTDPRHMKAVERHITVCPYCSAGRAEGLEPWAGLVEEWKNSLSASLPAVEAGKVVPGQIRLIRPELGRWRDNLFYTPPAVLVLGKISEVAEGFRVAQVFFDPAMAAPGDLVLDHERTGAGDLMVECWNTYPLMGEQLGPVVGSVSEDVRKDALRMAQDPAAVPHWAVNPRRVREHDPRIFFRELETEVQYVFASEAVARMIAEVEKRTVKSTVAEVVEFLKERFSRIPIPEELRDPLSILASVKLPLEGLTLAAAGQGRRRLAATLVRLEGGNVKEVRPVIAEIADEGSAETGRFVAGRVPDAVGLGVDSWLYCMMLRPGKTAIPASSVDWEAESGRFLARFEEILDGGGEFKIAVFYRLE
jgi:hypothetical protein